MITKIDNLIAETMKNREMEKLEALRMIKSTLTKAEKDGTELTDANIAKILLKMKKQSEDAISQFKSANRLDLVEKETNDLNVIMMFAPSEPSEKEIEDATKNICTELEANGTAINMAVMKTVMSKVQEKYPTASGKIISTVVRNWQK